MALLKPQNKTNNQRKTVLAGLFFCFCVLFYLTDGFGLLAVQPKNSLEAYDWTELKAIANEIAEAENDSSALEIATKYHIVDANGNIRADNTKEIKLRDGSINSVWISGIRRKEAQGDAISGLVFSFCSPIATKQIDPHESFTGGWDESDLRKWLNTDFYNNIPNSTSGFIKSVTGYSSAEKDGQIISVITKDSLYIWSVDEVSAVAESLNPSISQIGIWLRTLDETNPSYFGIEARGQISYEQCTQFHDVIPCFCY